MHPQLATSISKAKIDKLPLPSIVVHPPQDEVPLYHDILNKEIPASAQSKLLHDALDLAIVHVPRELEAASGAISEMKTIAVASQDVATEINSADNPITSIDSQVSSLLNALFKFNDVVTNIATV